jgi:hypothetical protein
VRNIRAASEDEVILSFLRSELDSPRFGSATRAALDRVGGTALVTHPELRSGTENEARREALAEARGWGTGEAFFAGFPRDIIWQHAELEVEELDRLRFIDYSYWTELSGGSRRAADVRAMLQRPDRLPAWLVEMGLEWPFELAGLIAREGLPGELIVVGTTDVADLVLLEGHARLTALFVGDLHKIAVPAFVGHSNSIRRWEFF